MTISILRAGPPLQMTDDADISIFLFFYSMLKVEGRS